MGFWCLVIFLACSSIAGTLPTHLHALYHCPSYSFLFIFSFWPPKYWGNSLPDSKWTAFYIIFKWGISYFPCILNTGEVRDTSFKMNRFLYHFQMRYLLLPLYIKYRGSKRYLIWKWYKKRFILNQICIFMYDCIKMILRQHMYHQQSSFQWIAWFELRVW